jgi:tagatose-6-phosphate ketose/aldose isomerase
VRGHPTRPRRPKMTNLARHATCREILAQPAIWRDSGRRPSVADLGDWIAATGTGDVWFCGAGSSACIGDILAAGFEGQPGPRLSSVPTTPIVARPPACLRGAPKPIVSFGRSGKATESPGLLAALTPLHRAGRVSASSATDSPRWPATRKPGSSPCPTPPTTGASR